MRSPTEPPDLSRPSSRLPAIGAINVAATAATTAARDLIIFLVILLLLGPPTQPPRLRPHLSAAYPPADPAPYIILLFSRL